MANPTPHAQQSGADLQKTRAALFALGPSAVHVLRTHLEQENVPNIERHQLEAAREILDRMGLTRGGQGASA